MVVVDDRWRFKVYYKEEEKKCNLKCNASHCYILCPIVLPLRYPSLRIRVRLCEEKLESLFDIVLQA